MIDNSNKESNNKANENYKNINFILKIIIPMKKSHFIKPNQYN
jgi:hypothetical protein